MCSEQMKLLISGHLDGCNTPKQEAVLEEHLRQCAECRRLLREYEAIDAELAGLTQAPPAGFSANVMNAISQEAPRPQKERKHAFRYGTMIAAAAAVLVLAVSAGHISMPKGGSAAIYPSVTEEAACEAPDMENYAMADQVPMEYHAEAEVKSASGASQNHSANADCAALANAEACYVGLLYADHTPSILINYSSTPLPGGSLYAVTPLLLNELQSYFPELQIFAPDGITPEETKEAYLFLMNDPA